VPLPPDAADLLLVRHGQSEPYLPGRPFPMTEGHGDPALSEAGHEQARQVCARLAAAGVSAVYVSPLRRAAQTAAPLAEALGITPRVEPDLREVHLGAWESGLYRQMVADGHPLAREVFARERWDVIPGAESPEALTARVRAVLGRIAAAHPGGRVAAFTHGGVIGAALALASGSRPFAFLTSDNGSVSRIFAGPGQWLVRCFNDTAHLHRAGEEPGWP